MGCEVEVMPFVEVREKRRARKWGRGYEGRWESGVRRVLLGIMSAYDSESIV